MTVINTSDAATDRALIDMMNGWTVEADGVDMIVQGSETGEDGYVLIVGLELDDEGNVVNDGEYRSVRFESASILIY